MRATVQTRQQSRRLRPVVATATTGGRPTLRRAAATAADLGRPVAPTYVVCCDCGGRIPAARLRARPDATRCIKCQLEFEHGRAA